MRIVAGKWAGKTLVSPGPRVRPTREEVRDAWISSLEKELPGARVLDLFSGTGALGLEALSRGASSVDFVENGAPALHALKANLARLRVKKRTRLFKKDAFAFLEGLERSPKPGTGRGAPDDRGPMAGPRAVVPPPAYDVALADPPYTSRAAHRLATLWLARPFSRILCLEHGADQSLPEPSKRRRFEETVITTYHLRPRNTGP